ncbi:unnamed protein product, partial [Gongylonema pulchrum]|uniref:Ovule protein n=1 Tax=Gongylonema pulchrum TaxID=637853 RepID=A0A183D9X5_9BILA
MVDLTKPPEAETINPVLASEGRKIHTGSESTFFNHSESELEPISSDEMEQFSGSETVDSSKSLKIERMDAESAFSN